MSETMERGPAEFELIDRIRRRATASAATLTGIGDDASVTGHDGLTATSVDAIVEGVHFDRTFGGPELITHKALATALSDLAAMAADPGEVYVTLGLPPDSPPGFAEALADGLLAAAGRWDVSLAGGDTVASPVLFLSVTAIGRAPVGEQLILRSGAKPGDLVALTGSLGGAGAGLLLLRGKAEGSGLDAGQRDELISRQLAPEPRLAVGRALRGSGVTSLIDISDGIGSDLAHLAESSGVAVTVEADRLPVQAGVEAVAAATGREALDLAVGSGEDYELAMTISPDRREAVSGLVAEAGSQLTVVGEVSEGAGLILLSDGRRIPVPAGFDHFG